MDSLLEDAAAQSSSPDLETQYKSIFDNAIEGIYQTSVSGSYLRVNPALAVMYGYASPEDLIENLTNISGQLYVDPRRRDAFKALMLEQSVVRNFEAQIYRRDGSILWISENARCVRDGSGAILYYEGMVEDITPRKQAEENMRLLATVFDSVADGILIVDANFRVQAVNPAYLAISGYGKEDLIGQTLDILEAGFHEHDFLQKSWEAMTELGHWSGEATCRRQNGKPFVAHLSFSAVRDESRRLSHGIMTCADISTRKEQEHKIWHNANYDLLTGLPNRWLATEHLNQAMLRARRSNSHLAVFFLDLNGFKQINDVMGHHAGDELLRKVAKRLQSCTRLSDIVGRLGGDEFLIAALDVADQASAALMVDKVLYSFSEPFTVGGEEIFCRPSIGVAVFPQDGDTTEALIQHADVAMYEAKRNKAADFIAYETRMQRHDKRLLGLESDLYRALERQEFQLHFQPKISAKTDRPIGAEALIRWHHPERGMVPPSDFIPLAEETGLILPIGDWVLHEACSQLKQWQDAGLSIGTVAVNLSPRQVGNKRLTKRLRQALDDTGVDPRSIELELTESAMSNDIQDTITTLRSLKDIGVTLAIDDFGTGYSSLTYLKKLPVDIVKIDQSFVREITTNTSDRKIVEVIVRLARILNLRVVAEGVETSEQARLLRKMKCHELQGYHFSRPLLPDAFFSYMLPVPQ
jgi:diguanylate cyclase (GGDEF)-like protein/PAS domain S-box-containing protein